MGLSGHWHGDSNRVLRELTSGTKCTHIGTVGTRFLWGLHNVLKQGTLSTHMASRLNTYENAARRSHSHHGSDVEYPHGTL